MTTKEVTDFSIKTFSTTRRGDVVNSLHQVLDKADVKV